VGDHVRSSSSIHGKIRKFSKGITGRSARSGRKNFTHRKIQEDREGGTSFTGRSARSGRKNFNHRKIKKIGKEELQSQEDQEDREGRTSITGRSGRSGRNKKHCRSSHNDTEVGPSRSTDTFVKGREPSTKCTD
jgi:hypothetical protein